MPLTDRDRLYFAMHPRRSYRLRRQTPAEATAGLILPAANFEPCCVVRRADGAVVSFDLGIGEALEDHESQLLALFDSLWVPD